MSEPGGAVAAGAVIAGVGARTAAGLTALQVTMSARARKLAPRASHMIDKSGQPIGMARLRSIGDGVYGMDRFLALAGPALIQAAHPWLTAQSGRTAARLPVIVALPSRARPGFDARLMQHLLPGLAARSQVPLDLDRSRLVCEGRGGGVAAVDAALGELRAGRCDAIAVGGVDSYFDPDALEHLDRELRLHGPETENGFIPGEGAGFLLLAARSRRGALPRRGRLLSAAVVDEPHPYGSAEPCLGLGMTLAVKKAAEAAGLGGAGSIPWALTDVANERHRVDEWTSAFLRNHAVFTQDVAHEAALLQTGDLGAASAAVLAAMAVTRWETGCAPGVRALIATHSDGPERGAMVLEQQTAR
ncbi:beta-ketoacyl synthase N-terminal-like domain-containing protein [Sorangium sp. So ce1014]|uniref:beta-ketoacyl synthase N-terminal-like domain-containing protein n=1 Tax=Sorangium sp. So ce1014 TaxID=3133326 RepID=UPI003F64386E